MYPTILSPGIGLQQLARLTFTLSIPPTTTSLFELVSFVDTIFLGLLSSSFL